MQAPRFWDNPPDRPGLTARLLGPLAALSAWQSARRMRRAGTRVAVPVICVGNLTVGGAGKTPLVMALVMLLQGAGHRVAVLSRGYGGRLKGPVLVDPARHRAGDVGDEPLLLAAFAPVWVGADRVASARRAVADGATVLVMDDGHQNPGLARDLSLVVVDAANGFGNGRCLPAGPLREPVAAGLARADLLVSVGDAAAQARFTDRWGPLAVPQVAAQMAVLPTGMDWAGLPVLAFAGIARPGRFFRVLRDLGADLVRAEALDDHQPLTPALMQRMETSARVLGAQLVTTEKDAVRLPPRFRQQVLTLPVRLSLRDEAPLRALLSARGIL